MEGPPIEIRDQARRQEAVAAHGPKRGALRLAMISALVQFALKGVTGLATGSLAVLATAMDSLGDFLNVAVGGAAIRLGLRPPDPTHAFGHGKTEALGALLQAVIILPLAALLVLQGIERLRQPAPVQSPALAVGVMLAAAIAGYLTARRLQYVSRQTDSVALKGVGLVFAVDAVTHTGVIVAILLSDFAGLEIADPLASFAVALYVVVQTTGLAAGAIHDLLDRQIPEAWRQRVIMELEEHAAEFIDYHRLRTRMAGPEKHIDLHLTLCRFRTLEESHRLVDHLENAIEAIIPQSQVIIHVDPCVTGETCPGEGLCELAADRGDIMPQTDWPAHPIGPEARETERSQHPPEEIP